MALPPQSPSTADGNGTDVGGGELWRDCVAWMVRCHLLDEKHRVNRAAATLVEFAQLLRDGVLLCQLANMLHKGAVDVREVSLRPQLSQYMCLKNICVFLGACQQTFQLSQRELFEAWELHKVANFGKVLQTLSTLSHCTVVKQSRPDIVGFPVHDARSSSQQHEYYNDEIYRSLAEEAESKVLEEEIYDQHGADEDEYGKIYDFIVGLDRPARQHTAVAAAAAAQPPATPSAVPVITRPEDFVPREKREYCIKELIDTERNYVDALNMILAKFYTPLRDTLSTSDHKLIFINMQELAQIHTAFYSELGRAVMVSLGRSVSTASLDSALAAATSPPPAAMRIGDVFVRWKTKFVAYSEYCINLTNARARIEQMCSESAHIRQRIIECQADANRNQFKLQDLLSVPMQRILKYHLLLKELVKCTPSTDLDRPSLDSALEAMVDISFYINEVKRDNETMQLIKDIQRSIVDLSMPENTDLSDYGRLLKDGELKLCDHHVDRSKIKNRYVFIFDRVLLICKALRGNQFEYKSAIVLSEYRLETGDLDNNKAFNLMKHVPKWSTGFSLVHHEQKNVLQMYTKSSDLKAAWIGALKMANDNVNPNTSVHGSEHQLLYWNFKEATECVVCLKLLRGLFCQGYRCAVCNTASHKECLQSLGGCSSLGGLGSPTRNGGIGGLAGTRRAHSFASTQQQQHRSSAGSHRGAEAGGDDTMVGARFKAVRTFLGNNGGPEFLCFNENDTVEIISVNCGLEGWWQGRVLDGPFKERQGLFPAEYVRKMRTSLVGVNAAAASENGGRKWDTWHGGSVPAGLGEQLLNRPVPIAAHTRHASSTSTVLNSPTTAAAGQGVEYVNTEVGPGHAWFMGDVDRQMAEMKLHGLTDGTYLVRFSQKQNRYAISMSCDREVKHVKIEHAPGGYYLDEGQLFPSIVELITYYQTHNLQESFHALNTTLRTPLGQAIVGYAVAVHNFTAYEPNMLSLSKGDQVMVLSKTGDERGWWKGKVKGVVGYFPLSYVSELGTPTTDTPDTTGVATAAVTPPS